MTKIRENKTAQLEKAAAKGAKFHGLKNMSVPSKISLVLLVLATVAFRRQSYEHL